LELQSLLKALGIPFLVAPSEAEAQCAALEQLGVVEGVVTEDSDAFLFGAKHVFRGVFQGNVRMYDSRSIEERLRLNREKLIIFALLLGSDYTPGVKGVGLVNAMEILKAFASLDRLQSFKSWARLPDVLLPSSEATD
jgi:DNA excision repair protein ERCC-5